MIGLPPAVSIYFCTAPVSMRLSFDGLAGPVRNTLALNPLSGHLFLFLSRRRDKAAIYSGDIRTGKFPEPVIPGISS